VLVVLVAAFILGASAISYACGYTAGKVGRKRDRTAERALADVNMWFMKNADVYPEAAISIQGILTNYYDKKEN
jgi:hypothetical protein